MVVPSGQSCRRVRAPARPVPVPRVRSLEEGATRWLGHQRGTAARDPGFLAAINRGDTAAVAHTLKQASYYSAGEADYARLMVRRDEASRGSAQAVTSAATRCASSAGASPVPVSAEAPGSRPQVPREISDAQAGYRKPVKRREPFSGKQARGPQHQVKPAASTEKQSGSRAAHFTAKATSDALVSERVSDLGGVWAQHVCKEKRGTREARLRSSRRGKRARISRWRNRAGRSGSPRGS